MTIRPLDYNKRGIGVSFLADKSADILVWCPKGKKVELRVEPSGLMIPLEAEDFGYWHAHSTALCPGDQYSFIIDGEAAKPDPASLSQPEGVHGPSQAIDLSFDWTDKTWSPPAMDELIIYELHTGTFTPEGNFGGIASQLDHLVDLGINAIEIMPVAQFPGERNWGYDGVCPFAVQHSYGGAPCLQELVNHCHAKGIAVILDVVYNHLGPEGNYLPAFGPYFTDKYKTPWGSAINFDDAECDPVRAFFMENVLMWFRDFHVDGLRLDAVHAIKDFSPTHILKEIKEYVDRYCKQSNRRHHLIVEMDLNDPRFIQPVSKQGYGMDAQWIDEFHHALKVTAGGSRDGYYSDFTGIDQLAKSYLTAYVFDGQYSPHRKRVFGSETSNPGNQFVVFSENHDQVGNRMLGERNITIFGSAKQRLMAAAVFLSPFIPMLFMGEEWAATNPFLYFVSHTDKELAEAVKKGRKAEFAAFQATGEAPDPNELDTFLQSKLQWSEINEEDHSKMLDFYKRLIRLRKKYQALSILSRERIAADAHPGKNALTLTRWSETETIVGLFNFSDSEITLSLPTDKKWMKIFDSLSLDRKMEVPDSTTVQVLPISMSAYLHKNV